MTTASSTSLFDGPVLRDGALHGVTPRDGAALEPVVVTSPDEVRAAVVSARQAQKEWSALGFEERARRLRAAAKKLLRRRSEVLALVEKELGKAPADALFTEALGPLDAVNGWVRVIEKAPAGNVGLNPITFPKKSARIELVPRGVVGVIAPWNFPVAGLYRSLFPALLLGNAVVLKPSEYSPRSSAWLASVLSEELGVGALQVVQGAGETGEALLNGGIDAVVFTGSSKVGALVEARAFELKIAVSAEMGGNDAAIVLDDCDLPRTVAGLTQWALENAGQACGAIEVVFVDRRLEAQLTERLGEAFRRLDAFSLAPLAQARQLEVVQRQIRDALDKGAELICGGVASGLSLSPTILRGCKPGMLIVDEETFGPVLPIVAVDGPAEAIRHVNAGKYGLTASLWTSDYSRAERLAADLDVGVVTINNHAFTGAIVELPWSGRRASGQGIANSVWSLATFARPKAIVIDRASGPEPFWLPYDRELVELGELLADAQVGKLFGAYKLPLLLRRRVQKVKAFFGID